MRYITILLLCGLLWGCGKRVSQSSKDRLERATARLAAASTPELKFYALGDAAKESFNAGKTEDAKKYAEELLALLPEFQSNREYGRAVHDANIVLGRIAVRESRLEDAKRYLMEAGQTPGTPEMMSYGPNMSLAKDLLQKGERQTVLDYFDLCRKFWTDDAGKLNQWTQQVKAGKIPDFGQNLSN